MTQSLPPKHIVLYADDDTDDILLVSEAFQKYGHHIELRTFEDGLELINHLEELTELDAAPCLLILDINMPRMNGKETLKHLRSLPGYHHVPVVLFSTSSMPADALFARKYDAGFITKPLVMHQLELIIDQFIDHCTDEVKERIKKV